MSYFRQCFCIFNSFIPKTNHPIFLLYQNIRSVYESIVNIFWEKKNYLNLFQITLQNVQSFSIRMLTKKKSLVTNIDSTNFIASQQSLLFDPQLAQRKKKQKQQIQRNRRRQLYFIKGMLGCLGGFMIHLVIGSLYQWGLFNPYITSYFIVEYGHHDLRTKDMVVIFPLMMFCIGVTMNVGLSFGAKYGFCKIMMIAVFLCSLSVFASSYFDLIGFVIFYAIGFGLLAGITFMVPMRICNDFFPNKQTYVNGFILIGTGLGSVVFGLFSIYYLNPQQYPPSQGLYINEKLKHIPANMSSCIRWLSLLYFIVGTAGTLLLMPLQQFNHVQQEMQKTVISKTLLKKQKPQQGYCLSARQAICSKIFWIHVFIIIMGSCGNLFINTNYKSYAQQSITDDHFLTIVGIVGSCGNGFSRFFWSTLFNQIGYKYIMSLILSINIICLSTVRFTMETSGVYLGQVFIFNCTLGGLLVLAPTFSTLIFGKQVGPRVFGFFWCSFAVGNFIQYFYMLFLGDISYIGLNGIIYICLVMNIINICVIFKYKFKGPWNNDLKYFKFQTLPRFQVVKDQNQLLIYSVVENRMKPEVVSSMIKGSTVIVYS